MLTIRTVAALLVFTFSASGALAQTFPQSDDFDAGLAGWTFTIADGEWRATGGNPAGCMVLDEEFLGQTFARAPTRYLGNWSALDGAGEIAFDFRVFSTGEYIGGGQMFVRLTGPGGSARVDLATFTGPTEWARFAAPLGVGNWVVQSGTWAGLLADVTEFAITIDIFDSTSRGEMNGVDNVRVGEPECEPDFDGDGFVTGADFDFYVAAFEAGDSSADFDGDGFVTGADFDRFVGAFELGC